MPVDPDVNDEDKFEDKIYCTLAPGDWMREETSSTQYIGSSDSEAEANRVLEIRTRDGWLRKIGEEQRNDQVMQSAFKQLSQHGRVYSGQLKGASAYLRLKGETIYFDERVVVPRNLRLKVLERVHNESHFGQARTMELIKRSYFWHMMARDVRYSARDA